MHAATGERLRRFRPPLHALLRLVARPLLALMLLPSVAWGQTVEEMKQMLQQVLEQNKTLQEPIERLEKELAPPPAAPSTRPSAEAKKPEPPPTTGERISKLEDLVKDLKLLPFV